MEPIQSQLSPSSKCTTHNKLREVMCKKCKKLFCPKCVSAHLKEAHEVDFLVHFDSTPTLYKDKICKRVQEFSEIRKTLENAQADVQKRFDVIKDEKDLDSLCKEYVEKVEQEILKARKRREDACKELLEVSEKIKVVEKKCEEKQIRFVKAIKGLDEKDPNNFLNADDVEELGIEAEAIESTKTKDVIEEVNTILKEFENNVLKGDDGRIQILKRNMFESLQRFFDILIHGIPEGPSSKNSHEEANEEEKDFRTTGSLDLSSILKESEQIKKQNDEIIENAKIEVKKAKETSEQIYKECAEKKSACLEELKMAEEKLKKTVDEFELVKTQLTEKQKELSDLKLGKNKSYPLYPPSKASTIINEEQKLLPQNLKKQGLSVLGSPHVMQPSDHNYVKCQNCNASTNTTNGCIVCKKTICLRCSRSCAHCSKKACEKCTVKCKECYDFACNTCNAANDCCRTSIVSLERSTRFLYLSCEPLGGMKELCTFDLSSKKLVNLHIEIPWENRIIQLLGRIFITGGYKNGNSVADVSEFLETTKTLVSKAPMINPRHTHTLARISKTSFAAIGGYTYGQMRECEKYDVAENQWKSLPTLNEAKQLVGCLLVQGRYLYCFGGKRADGACKTLERLDLQQPNPQWSIIHLHENQAVDGWCAALYQVTRNEIIILRGRNMSDAYLYDIKENVVKKYEKIYPMPEVYTNQLYRVGETICTVGYYGNVHIFNVKNGDYEPTKCEDAK